MKEYQSHNHNSQPKAGKPFKVLPTDILVLEEVVRHNQERILRKPRKKRHINYAKKIMNDPFILNI